MGAALIVIGMIVSSTATTMNNFIGKSDIQWFAGAIHCGVIFGVREKEKFNS